MIITIAPSSAQVSFCAVGDVMLARSLRARIFENGVNYPFERVQTIISAADISLANLECPLCPATIARPIRKKYSFRGEPEYTKGLRFAGFDIVSIANNHASDCGPAGRKETKKTLDSLSIATCGMADEFGNFRPAILDMKGIKLAFFAFSDIPASADSLFEKLLGAISSYRDSADCIIISIHWGHELDSVPRVRQTRMAHQMADAGAGLVIGHHPHVLQGIESYRGKLILYSLGNFVFDNSQVEQSRSAIFRCKIGHNGVDSAEIIPVSIKGYRPEPAEGDAKAAIVEELIRLSEVFGTKLIESDAGLVVR